MTGRLTPAEMREVLKQARKEMMQVGPRTSGWEDRPVRPILSPDWVRRTVRDSTNGI